MVFRPGGWVNAEEEEDAGEINYTYNICKSKGHCPSQGASQKAQDEALERPRPRQGKA